MISDELCLAYRSGAIDFNRFERETRSDWKRAAAWIVRRWKVIPSVVPEDDVFQALITGAWEAFGRFDPNAGFGLRQYVWWSAMHQAMRYVHCEREAKRRSGKNPERRPIPVESFDRFETVAPDQEHVESLKRALSFRIRSEVEVLLKFMDRGASDAAWRVLSSQRIRESLGVRDHRSAKREVLRIASEFESSLSAT